MALHRHEYSIEEMARALGVSTQGFYLTQKRGLSRRRIRWESLALLIQVLYDGSGGSYGSRRIRRALLRSFEIKISQNQVCRLMRWLNLRSRRGKKFRVKTTDSSHSYPISPNLLKYVGAPVEKNRIWISDITYLKVPKGWIYLCIVMDLFSRKIVGWALRDHMKASLVTDALRMALRRRTPAGGLIFHSDRGSQYASHECRTLLRERNMLQSMSRRGNCWDNAWAESWFASLKLEMGSEFADLSEGEQKIFQFVEAFYNRQRIHSSLDYYSPEEFEEKVA